MLPSTVVELEKPVIVACPHHSRISYDCVHMPGILAGLKSIYWWDGKVQKDNELLLVMKTQAALLQQLVEVVKKHHPYDEPEVISLPISGGSSSYIKWIHDSTGS